MMTKTSVKQIVGYYLHNGCRSKLQPYKVLTNNLDDERKKLQQQHPGYEIYLVHEEVKK